MFSIQGMKILKKDQYSISVEIVSLWDDDIVADDIVDLSIYAGDDAIDAHAMSLRAEDYKAWNQFLMAKGHHRCYMLLDDNPYISK
jgi:hypothetical protein